MKWLAFVLIAGFALAGVILWLLPASAFADSKPDANQAAREHEALAAVIAALPAGKTEDGKPVPPTTPENVAQRVRALVANDAHCQKFVRVVGLSMQQIEAAAQ